MPLEKHYDLEKHRRKFPERFARYADLEFRPEADRLAANVLGYAVEGIICGYAGAGLSLARRCVELISAGSELSADRRSREIREPRERFLHGAESYRLWYLGIAQWLIGGPCTETYRAAVRQIEIADACEKNSHYRESADHYMELAVQTGNDAHSLAYYRQTCRDAAKPLDIRHAYSVRRVCEAICRHRLNNEFTGEEIRHALDRLLLKKIEPWLVAGWACGVADLLKIRFSDLDGITSPIAILQRTAGYLRPSHARRVKFEVILTTAAPEIAP